MTSLSIKNPLSYTLLLLSASLTILLLTFFSVQDGGVSLNMAFAQASLLTNPFGFLLNGFIGIALSIPIFIAGMFLLITATFFDYLVDETVVGFSALYTTYFNDGVTIAWAVFRDLGNIIMIGMFVFVAFSVILNSSKYGLKQFGARILIVAVLINFSLFFTKVVIDISNITAAQFRNEIIQTVNLPAGSGIAEVFMSRAGLSSSIGGLAADAIKNTVKASYSSNGGVWTYVLITTLFLAMAGSIFLFAGIMLLSRAVAFILLMVVSPLAFVALMTPGMDQWWTRWWTTLLKNAIFAPIFFILLWASILITGGFHGKNNLYEVATREGSSFIDVQAIFFISIVLGLLYASTKLASSLSIAGAEKARTASLSFGLQASGIGAALGLGLKVRNAALAGTANRLGKSEFPGAQRFASRMELMSKNTHMSGTALGKASKSQGISFGKDISAELGKYIQQKELEKNSGGTDRIDSDISAQNDKKNAALSQNDAIRQERDNQLAAAESDKNASGAKLSDSGQQMEADLAGAQALVTKANADKARAEALINDESADPAARSQAQKNVIRAQEEISGQDSKIAELEKSIRENKSQRDSLDSSFTANKSAISEKADKEIGDSASAISSIDRNIAALNKERASSEGAAKSAAIAAIEGRTFLSKATKTAAVDAMNQTESSRILDALKSQMKKDMKVALKNDMRSARGEAERGAKQLKATEHNNNNNE